MRVAIGLFLLVVIYSGFSAVLNVGMDKKNEEAVALQTQISGEIEKAAADNEKIQSRTNDYKDLVDEIQAQNEKEADANQTRDAIPNLLNKLMYNIPEDARINKIENTEDRHIVIYAQAVKYEQLGYFKARIKSEGILNNVTSTGGTKSGEIITIKIEGDLPWKKLY